MVTRRTVAPTPYGVGEESPNTSPLAQASALEAVANSHAVLT